MSMTLLTFRKITFPLSSRIQISKEALEDKGKTTFRRAATQYHVPGNGVLQHTALNSGNPGNLTCSHLWFVAQRGPVCYHRPNWHNNPEERRKSGKLKTAYLMYRCLIFTQAASIYTCLCFRANQLLYHTCNLSHGKPYSHTCFPFICLCSSSVAQEVTFLNFIGRFTL